MEFLFEMTILTLFTLITPIASSGYGSFKADDMQNYYLSPIFALKDARHAGVMLPFEESITTHSLVCA